MFVSAAGFCCRWKSPAPGVPPPCHWITRPWLVAWLAAAATVRQVYVPTVTGVGVGTGVGGGVGAGVGVGGGVGGGVGAGVGVGVGGGVGGGVGAGVGVGVGLSVGVGPSETT